jgi:coenzyme F420 hydrogenase subunit beta
MAASLGFDALDQADRSDGMRMAALRRVLGSAQRSDQTAYAPRSEADRIVPGSAPPMNRIYSRFLQPPAKVLGTFADRISRKQWTTEDVSAMVGQARSAYLTYATDASIRSIAASGGTTSAILMHALRTGLIDGAVICRTVIVDGKVRAQFMLARTPEEILAARGSKYVETRFLRDVLPILEESEGRFAVCGLPCDITNLSRWEERKPMLKKRVALRLAFFCGHNSRTTLIDAITDQIVRENGNKQIKDFRFRVGHWRGKLQAELEDGTVVEKPFSTFSNYRNCHFFSERKCLACIDHFGYDADISLGDVWLYALRDYPIKHTGVLVRSERAQAVFDSAFRSGALHADQVPLSTILDGQSRIAPVHYNITARSRAGKGLGVKIPDTQHQKVSWAKYLSAYLTIADMRWSEKHADAIFRVPQALITPYLFFKKGLEILR